MLDNLSTHCTDEIEQWLAKNPHIAFHSRAHRVVLDEPNRSVVRCHHPPGHLPRNVRITQTSDPDIERYSEDWNTGCEPFVWTATREILAKVNFIESEVRRMLDCNAK